MKKVMIDSGHFKSNSNKGQTGYYEHEGVWKISNYLKDILTLQGIQADLTKTYEIDMELYLRGEKAQNYDLFISEHTNAHNDTSVRGVECFYDFSKPEDKFWAEELTKTISELMGNTNRGAKIRTYDTNGITYNYYGVIRGASATNCPHIFLIESGFHSNLIDEAFLKIDDNLKKIAEVQAKIICKILGVEYNNSTLLYRVQVGAFGNETNAINLLKELTSKGYPAIIKTDNDEIVDIKSITEQVTVQVTEQVKQEYELKYEQIKQEYKLIAEQKIKDYKDSLIDFINESE